MNDFIEIIEILKYGILVILLLGVTSAILSPFIVHNNQSLIADGLSHVSFMAIAISVLFFEEPIILSIILVVVLSIVIKWISSKTKLDHHATLAMISALSFAIGLIIIKYANNPIDLTSLITGNMWLRSSFDVILAAILLVLTALFIFINYRKLILLSYDESYARFKKIKVDLLNYILAALIGLFVVLGVRSVGILLISSLLIFPAILGGSISKSFKNAFIFGFIFNLTSIILGLIIAHVRIEPASSWIVIINMLLFSIINITKFIYKRSVING